MQFNTDRSGPELEGPFKRRLAGQGPNPRSADFQERGVASSDNDPNPNLL